MIYIGSDHAGYELKEKIKNYLSELNYQFEDIGPFEFERDDDYPDFIIPVAKATSHNKENRGIVIGGSGQGEAICANKVKDIRATTYYGGDLNIVKISREHNNANTLSIGARFASEEEAKRAVKIFLETPFSKDERHIRRINKIEQE